MSSAAHRGAGRHGALFYCSLAVAALLVIRPIVSALGAPLAVRLLLGITLVMVLVAVAGVLIARRLHGDVTGRLAYSGLLCVASVLVPFALIVRGHDPAAIGVFVFIPAAVCVVVVGLRAART